MKRSALYALAALTFSTALASAAAADERVPQWYVGLSGGYSFMEDQDISGNTSATSVQLNSGYTIGGSIGYLPNSSIPLINSMRFEGEIVQHRNNIKSVVSNVSSTAGTGYYSSTGYMVNAFYDMPTGTAWAPFIGAGAGIAAVNMDANPGIGNSGNNDEQFAYQALVGVGYTPAVLPDTQWTVGYRYFATSNPSFSSASGGSDINAKYAAQSLELGAKFRF